MVGNNETHYLRNISILTIFAVICIVVYGMTRVSSTTTPMKTTSTQYQPTNTTPFLSTSTSNAPAQGCNTLTGYRLPGADATGPDYGAVQPTALDCLNSCASDNLCKQYVYANNTKNCYKMRTPNAYNDSNKDVAWTSGICTK